MFVFYKHATFKHGRPDFGPKVKHVLSMGPGRLLIQKFSMPYFYSILVKIAQIFLWRANFRQFQALNNFPPVAGFFFSYYCK